MSIMYKEEIALCCKQLRLSSNLVEQAMSVEGATNQEYLYHVLSNEVDYRRKCRISKLLSTAGFPRIHTFPQFKSDEVVFQSDCSVERLEALEFRKKGFNIIMYGGTGTGKTMLSICIGIRLCEESIPAVFFRTASLVNQLSEHKADGTLTRCGCCGMSSRRWAWRPRWTSLGMCHTTAQDRSSCLTIFQRSKAGSR